MHLDARKNAKRSTNERTHNNLTKNADHTLKSYLKMFVGLPTNNPKMFFSLKFRF